MPKLRIRVTEISSQCLPEYAKQKARKPKESKKKSVIPEGAKVCGKELASGPNQGKPCQNLCKEGKNLCQTHLSAEARRKKKLEEGNSKPAKKSRKSSKKEKDEEKVEEPKEEEEEDEDDEDKVEIEN